MASSSRETRAVAQIACPRCGAAKGEPCRGMNRPLRNMHGPACCSERRQANQERTRNTLLPVVDPLEAEMMRILDLYRIEYSRPEKDPTDTSTLDFYLPTYGLSVEVKAWSCERLHEQIRDSGKEESGVMVLIGIAAVRAFGALLEGRRNAT